MGFKGILKFLLIRGCEVLVFVLLVLFMPNVPPQVKIRDSYSVIPPKPLEGKLALNERLNNAELWHKGDVYGPEAFADFNGELYTTLQTGDLVKLTGEHITPIVKFGKPCKGVYQERLCGRPLGMSFAKDGSLIVADAYYGIFKVDVKTGDKVQLVSQDVEIEDRKPKITNSVVVATNGDVYWSDSSTDFSLEDGVFDLFADGTGRLVHYDAKTKKNKVLLDYLLFANGVALSEDEEFVVVSETGKNRLHRCFLKGSKKGTCEIFIDGLPGMPDNIKADGQGGFLVPLVVAVDKDHPSASQILGPFPLIRKFIARIVGLVELGFKLFERVYPNEYSERAVHFVGHFQSVTFLFSSHRVTVLHISKTGEIINSYHALDKKITGISEAHIFKNFLYLGSPFNDYIARVPLENAGLTHLALNLVQQKQPPLTETPPVPKTTTTPQPKQTQAPPVTTTTQAPPTTTTQAPPRTTKKTAPPVKQTPPPTTTQKPTSTAGTKDPPTIQKTPDAPNSLPTDGPTKSHETKNVKESSVKKDTGSPVKEVPPSVGETPTLIKETPKPVKEAPAPVKNAQNTASSKKETSKSSAPTEQAAQNKQAPPIQGQSVRDDAKGTPAVKETKTTK